MPEHEFQPSPFFAEQLCAFELWLDAGSQRRRPPEQLPIVLQAANGPCPLLAIANVLLLRGQITLPINAPDISEVPG